MVNSSTLRVCRFHILSTWRPTTGFIDAMSLAFEVLATNKTPAFNGEQYPNAVFFSSASAPTPCLQRERGFSGYPRRMACGLDQHAFGSVCVIRPCGVRSIYCPQRLMTDMRGALRPSFFLLLAVLFPDTPLSTPLLTASARVTVLRFAFIRVDVLHISW